MSYYKHFTCCIYINTGPLSQTQHLLSKASHSQHTAEQSPTAELYPNSGLFLSSTRLAAIQQEAKKDCLRLFHLLFDEFFTPEECINCVAFGKHGKVPEGKKKLDESKVKGILSK